MKLKSRKYYWKMNQSPIALKSFAIFLLLILAGFAGANEDTGKGKPSPRIIGGRDAAIGEVPWYVAQHVHIRFTDNKPSISRPVHCSGAIIHEQWVLTAGHCASIFNKNGMDLFYGTNEQNGALNLPNDPGPSVRVDTVVLHPNYNPTDKSQANLQYDLALLHTLEPMALDGLLAHAVKVAGSTTTVGWDTFYMADPPVGTVLQVAGFGRNDTTNPSLHPLKLQITEVEVGDRADCARKVTGNPNAPPLPDGLICTTDGATVQGKSPCKGDSGGALVYRVYSDEEHWYKDVLVGVTSFVTKDCAGLGALAGAPPPVVTGYVRFWPYHINWIHSVVGEI